ncbi:hypothetical protein CFC35_05615 [Streptomyces sp. FBKL.4005]|uniref:hypothetical protein n=1 Tax=Streptomyces sp. FBKL.4005 TaxID=2015515 RepID=UPI000B96F3F3|nr:hypothetical protein [Streptomyces sp. FBKL.4005]OYP14043.1 hypothetical protein CFC35_05615 [Streptomyces sp. FBKL.4005]
MNQPDPEQMSVEERVARHLAAKDWLTTSDHWDHGSASFRADYLNHAREVIAIVRAAVSAPQSPADRAAEHTCGNCEGIDPGSCLVNPDRAAAPTDWIDGHPQLEAIAAAVWERCGRSDSGACVEDDPRNIAVAALAAMLAVLPEPVDRAAVRAEAFEDAAKMLAGLDPVKAALAGQHAWNVAAGLVRHMAVQERRLAGEQPTNSKAPTDRAAIERAFAERLAAELTGCCTECDACIEIAQHLAGKDEPAAEERKQPPMDPVHILGIAADTPAPVAEQPAAADAEETRGGCGHGPERHGPEFGCVECRCPSTTGHA